MCDFTSCWCLHSLFPRSVSLSLSLFLSGDGHSEGKNQSGIIHINIGCELKMSDIDNRWRTDRERERERERDNESKGVQDKLAADKLARVSLSLSLSLSLSGRVSITLSEGFGDKTGQLSISVNRLLISNFISWQVSWPPLFFQYQYLKRTKRSGVSWIL